MRSRLIKAAVRSGCAVQTLPFRRRPQSVQVLTVKGTKSGFDGGAQADDSVTHVIQRCDPSPGSNRDSRASRGGWASRMRGIIKFSARDGSQHFQFFVVHDQQGNEKPNDGDILISLQSGGTRSVLSGKFLPWPRKMISASDWVRPDATYPGGLDRNSSPGGFSFDQRPASDA